MKRSKPSIVVTPSDEVKLRAMARGFKKEKVDEKRGFLLYGPEHTSAVLMFDMFPQSVYLGTATIVRHKMLSSEQYYLTDKSKSAWQGELIKLGLKVLGTRRVRIYIAESESDEGHFILTLGTNEGSFAVAPRVKENDDIRNDERKALKNYLQGETSGLRRYLIFGNI